MGFWDEHAKSEAADAEAERAKLPPSAQDAPAMCLECGHLGTDVFFGSCGPCFDAWEAGR
jgi:hypothetical protein